MLESSHCRLLSLNSFVPILTTFGSSKVLGTLSVFTTAETLSYLATGILHVLLHFHSARWCRLSSILTCSPLPHSERLCVLSETLLLVTRSLVLLDVLICLKITGFFAVVAFSHFSIDPL